MLNKRVTEVGEDISFCVIVPMYNEMCNAERCVRSIAKFLAEIDLKSSVVVVDDGSTDDTGSILRELSFQIPSLFVETHSPNRGYGAASITGARRALHEGYDYALFMDADLTQNVKYIEMFIQEMRRGTDFIKATRYARGGGVRGVPLKRWLISWVGNLMARLFLKLPLTDYTNGFRAVKTEILAQIDCEEQGFAYLVEETRKVAKIAQTFAEVPYMLTIRENCFSKSKFNYSPTTYYSYLKHLFKND